MVSDLNSGVRLQGQSGAHVHGCGRLNSVALLLRQPAAHGVGNDFHIGSATDSQYFRDPIEHICCVNSRLQDTPPKGQTHTSSASGQTLLGEERAHWKARAMEAAT